MMDGLHAMFRQQAKQSQQNHSKGMLLQSLSYHLPWQNHLLNQKCWQWLTQKSFHGLRYWDWQAATDDWIAQIAAPTTRHHGKAQLQCWKLSPCSESSSQQHRTFYVRTSVKSFSCTCEHCQAPSPAFCLVERQFGCAIPSTNDVCQTIPSTHQRQHHHANWRFPPKDNSHSCHDDHIKERSPKKLLPVHRHKHTCESDSHNIIITVSATFTF